MDGHTDNFGRNKNKAPLIVIRYLSRDQVLENPKLFALAFEKNEKSAPGR